MPGFSAALAYSPPHTIFRPPAGAWGRKISFWGSSADVHLCMSAFCFYGEAEICNCRRMPCPRRAIPLCALRLLTATTRKDKRQRKERRGVLGPDIQRTTRTACASPATPPALGPQPQKTGVPLGVCRPAPGWVRSPHDAGLPRNTHAKAPQARGCTLLAIGTARDVSNLKPKWADALYVPTSNIAVPADMIAPVNDA